MPLQLGMPGGIRSGITLLLLGFISAIAYIIYMHFQLKREEKLLGDAKKESENLIKNAEKSAKEYIKNAELEAKQLKIDLKEKADKEIKERRAEISVQENRIFQKEEQILKKEEKIEKEYKRIDDRLKEIESRERELSNLEEEKIKILEKISNLTKDEAKEELLNKLDRCLINEKAEILNKYKEELDEEKNNIAKEILATAIQRCATDHTSESTVSIVPIPNDEMKGRIIGKEGRNIRTLETLIGVQFIIDDTPEAITVSAFDPVRREVARITLEKLIADGRIHPAKIEEMVEKAVEEVDDVIRKEGKNAMLDSGISDLTMEEIKTLGKLKFRTSYGQNVLNHSIEVANLAGLMARMIGADVNLAIRGGLLHDIGKALDHDPEVIGTHVELGVELLRRNKENEKVLNAVEAHHGDVEPLTVEAVLVQAADAISASRPGARRDTFEAYIKRLESLEQIANSFEGVKKSYAIQAGREIRIIVDPLKISDNEISVLAHDISVRIENEVAFPGQIKVMVIRERRSSDYAKKSRVNI